MPSPATNSPEDLLALVDEIEARRDELFAAEYPNGDIDPDDQSIWDRLNEKIEELKRRAQSATPPSAGSNISGSVGRGGQNAEQDVVTVQTLLNDNGASLAVDGLSGPKTEGAISAFQQRTFGWQDALVEVGKPTITALTGGPVEGSEGEDDLGSDTGSSTGPNTGSEAAPDTGSNTGTGGADDGASELPEPEDIPGIEMLPDGGNEPVVVDGNPNDPDVMEQLLEEQLQCLPDPEVSVDPTDENGDVLSFVEFPFLMGQEISLGLKIGDVDGTLKIKFNNDGQIETAAIEMQAIPSVTLAAGSHGVMAKGELKPFSVQFTLKKNAGSLGIDLTFSTSGSMMVGLGAAKGESWAGLGVEVELKMSRDRTLSTELAMSTLEEMVRNGTNSAMNELAFGLPATFTLAGTQSFVIGGSGAAKKVGASIASKITLKSYDPMITAEMSENEVKITAYDGLYQMIEDHARATFPMLDLAIKAYELGEEIAEFVDDPESYVEDKQREYEELKRRALALPGVIQDLIAEEMRKLDSFESELARQLEEWREAAGEEIDELVEDAEDMLDEVVDGVEEVVGGIADDIMDVADELGDQAGELVDEVQDGIDEALETAEDLYEQAEDAVGEGVEAAEDLYDEGAEVVGDAVDSAVETAEGLYEDGAEAVDDAVDAAEEFYDDAVEEIEEVGESIFDQVMDAVDGAGDMAEDALDEVMDAAESARDTVEDVVDNVRESGEGLLERVMDTAGDAIDDVLDAGESAVDTAKDTAEAAYDTAQDVAEDTLEVAENVYDAASDVAEDVADSVGDALDSVGDAAEDLADKAKNKLKNLFS